MKIFEILSHLDYNILIEIMSILVTLFIYCIARKISTSTKLEHKHKIKKQIDDLIAVKKMSDESLKVVYVNTKRYFKNYLSDKENLFTGYIEVIGELKGTSYNGIESFSGNYHLYNSKLDTKDAPSDKNGELVFMAHITPYGWVEYVDPAGDEYRHIPIIFCKFKGRRFWKDDLKRFILSGYPFTEVRFYKKSEKYQQQDPDGMKHIQVRDKIRKKYYKGEGWKYYISK